MSKQEQLGFFHDIFFHVHVYLIRGPQEADKQSQEAEEVSCETHEACKETYAITGGIEDKLHQAVEEHGVIAA